MTIVEITATAVMALAMAFLSVEDIRFKSINIIAGFALAAAMAGFSFWHGNDAVKLVVGCIPGIVAAVLSAVTRGKLGIGDAIVILAVGIWCGIDKTGLILMIALACAALVAAVLLVIKKATRKTALPFIPFIFAGYITCEILSRLQ